MFVQSQKGNIREELSQILPPLLCHLYVEMLKGREWKPAIDFLKKYAHIIGTIEPSVSNQFTKVNGTIEETASNIVPIIFTSDGNESLVHFRQLISTLSTITGIQDIESDLLVANFRSCKYEVKFSNRTINALKRFLKDTHVLILQVLTIWIYIETLDDKCSDDEEELMNDSLLQNSGSSLNGFTSNLDDLHETDISKFTNLLASPKPMHRESHHRDEKYRGEPYIKTETTDDGQILEMTETKAIQVTRLENLVRIEEKINSHQIPVRCFAVQNAREMLCTGNLDISGCHFACGMENSTILLWSSDRSIQTGRKPYSKISTRACCWHATAVDEYEYNSSSEDEEICDTRAARSKRIHRLKREQNYHKFLSKRCTQNIM